MSIFDTRMLKRNIKILKENKNITQAKLAEITGMSQSNVSKALNENEKKCFTLEQVFSIAAHFNVSIDDLCGNTVSKPSSGPRAIAQFISNAIEQGTAEYTHIEKDVDIFEMSYADPYPNYNKEAATLEYPAFYFPNYWDDNTRKKYEESFHKNYKENRYAVNDTGNMPLNEYFRKFIVVYELYNKGELPEDAYRIIIKDYLSQLKEVY